MSLSESFEDFYSEGSLMYYVWLEAQGVEPMIHSFWSPDALSVDRVKAYIAEAEKDKSDAKPNTD